MLNSHSLFRRRDLILLLAFAVIVLTSGVSAAAETSKKLRLAYAGWEIGTAVAYVGVDSGLMWIADSLQEVGVLRGHSDDRRC